MKDYIAKLLPYAVCDQRHMMCIPNIPEPTVDADQPVDDNPQDDPVDDVGVSGPPPPPDDDVDPYDGDDPDDGDSDQPVDDDDPVDDGDDDDGSGDPDDPIDDGGGPPPPPPPDDDNPQDDPIDDTGIAGHCLVADTLIRTSLRQVPVCEIEVGEVLGGEYCEGETVVDVMVSDYEGPLYTIQVEDVTVQVTESHPFMVFNDESGLVQVPASELEVGGSLFLCDEGGEVVQSPIVSIVVDYDHEPVPVYNLEVTGEHVYWANGFLVHNKIWSDPPDDGRLNEPSMGNLIDELMASAGLTPGSAGAIGLANAIIEKFGGSSSSGSSGYAGRGRHPILGRTTTGPPIK